MSISFISTRGQAPALDFRGATLAGLAPDGGLYVPQTWPQFDVKALQGKSYVDIAHAVLSPFVEPHIPGDVLKDLLKKSYAVFADPAVAPLKQLDDRHWVLELFHGPTLAFKDIALQLLGHIFEYFLAQKNERMTVIGATSGDTGSAAIAALANRKNIDVFVLYPQNGPSDIQRKQMTCVDAPNVHAIGIEGTFDDCQAIVKALFADVALRAKYNFAAVNSINILRILAQTVYYIAVAAHFSPRPISFVVPTGNFGNVYAGYVAHKCGVPISKLAVASNRNDILTRFFNSGAMQPAPVQSSLSPSMDIQISSNFERLLFDLCGNDAARLRDLMKNKGEFSVSKVQLAQARQLFTAARTDDDLTLQTIRDMYKESNYILDPHSAVAVAASRQLAKELPEPVVMLATAHPAKFPETIERAIGIKPELPASIAALLQKPERTTVLPPRIDAVTQFISSKAA